MDKLVRKTNALIMRIAKGDKSALGSLYELTSGYLLNMARAYVRDRSLAEDVVSETYLKAVRGAGSFDPKGNGLNWLFKIVRNTAFNLNSYENRRRHEDIEAHLDIADVFDAVDDARLDMKEVRAAVRALPPEERALLYYRYWEGYTVRELAALTGKPVSTTQDALKRILKKLKNKL